MDVETTPGASSQVIDAGKKASNVLLDQGTLGALVILLTIAVGILIWLLYKSKNAHITDKDRMIGVLNTHSLESQGLLKDTRNSIDNLIKDIQAIDASIKDSHRSLDSLSKESERVFTSIGETRKSLDALLVQWERWKIAQKRSG
jgi:uncharacterized protein HemX